MKWTWKVARVAGIDLRVHASFLLLIAWVAFVYYRAFGASSAIVGVVFTLALFASVILHEFGHAYAARRLGVPTRDITLLPIGGVAQLEFIPERPRDELAIALAGPGVTLTIIVVLGAVLRAMGVPAEVDEGAIAHYSLGVFLAQVMWMNISLLLFNLVPAFPMDGGRVLRALLALRGDYATATARAAKLGRMFAILFGVVGLLYSPLLVLIAVFVWIGAAAESVAAQERAALRGLRVDQLMIRQPATLSPEDSLRTALEHILAGFQHDFPVVHGETVVGVLTQRGLLNGLAHRGELSLVATSMEAVFRVANPGEPVTDALARLRECRCHTLPVVANGQLVGVLTADNVAEYVMIEMARRQAPPSTPATMPSGSPLRAT
jgi:Zn-dependent protease/predicted transcriptional regulator